jgi:hypothetical protein
MEIIVCPRSQLTDTLGRSRAQHVITLVRSEEPIKRERDGTGANGEISPPERYAFDLSRKRRGD